MAISEKVGARLRNILDYYYTSLGKVKIQDHCDSVAFLVLPEDQLKAAVGADVSIDVERKGRRSDIAGRPWLSETGVS